MQEYTRIITGGNQPNRTSLEEIVTDLQTGKRYRIAKGKRYDIVEPKDHPPQRQKEFPGWIYEGWTEDDVEGEIELYRPPTREERERDRFVQRLVPRNRAPEEPLYIPAPLRDPVDTPLPSFAMDNAQFRAEHENGPIQTEGRDPVTGKVGPAQYYLDAGASNPPVDGMLPGSAFTAPVVSEPKPRQQPTRPATSLLSVSPPRATPRPVMGLLSARNPSAKPRPVAPAPKPAELVTNADVAEYHQKFLTGEQRNAKSEPFRKLGELLNKPESQWNRLLEGYSPVGRRAIIAAARQARKDNAAQYKADQERVNADLNNQWC